MKKKLLALVLALTFVVPMSLTSPLAAAAMTLTITVEDSDVSYSVTVEDTMEYVYNLKCAIQEQTNFPAYLQTLYYGGSALDDFDMLASLGISDGKTLMLGKLYNITTEHAKAIVLDNYNHTGAVEADQAPAGIELQIWSDESNDIPDGKYLTCDFEVNGTPLGEPGSGTNSFTMPPEDVHITNPIADQRVVTVNLTSGEATMTRIDYTTLSDDSIPNNPRRYDETDFEEYFDFDNDGVYDVHVTEDIDADIYKLKKLETTSTLDDEYVCDLSDKHYEIGSYRFILKNPKQAQTITFNGFTDSKATKTYGDAAFSLGATSQGGALTYTPDNSGVVSVDDSGIVTILKAGTSNINVTAAQTDNYFEGTATFTVTVAPKEITLQWGTEKLVYNGSEQAPSVTAGGLVGNDTLTVGIKKKGKTAGDHFAEAVLSNGNYKLPNDHTHEYTIEPKPVTVSWSNLTFTYNGTNTFLPTANAQGLCGSDTCAVTVNVNEPGKDVGTYTATAVGLENENYTLNGAVYTTQFKVEPKEVILNWDQTSFIADGTTEFCPQATAAGLCGTDKCTVTITGGSKEPGKHTATATALSNANYKLPAENTVEYTVLHSGDNALTVTIANWTYGDSPKTPKAVYTPDQNRAVTFEYKTFGADDSEYTPNVPTQAGKYTLRASVAKWEFGDAATAKCDFQIYKKTAVYTAPTALKLTYNFTRQKLVSPGVSGEGTFEYSLDNKWWSSEIPEASLAGNYTVQWVLVGDDNHIGTKRGSNSVSVTIAKANAALTAPTAIEKLTYTGEPQELVKQTPSNEGTYEYSLDQKTWSTDIPTATDAGTYTVHWSFIGDANHNSTKHGKSTPVTVKIAPAEAVFTEPVPKPDLIYNDKLQVLTLVTLSKLGSFEFSVNGGEWSKEVPLAKNAGDYKIDWKFIPNTNNYLGKKGSFTNTIMKASGTATIALKQTELSLTYYDPEVFVYDLSNVIISSVGKIVCKLYNAEGVNLEGTVLTFPKKWEGMMGILIYAKGDENHYASIGMLKIYLNYLTKEERDKISGVLVSLPPNAFDELPRLQTLDLSGGSLESLDPSYFTQLPSLLNSPLILDNLTTDNMNELNTLQDLSLSLDPFTLKPVELPDNMSPSMFTNLNVLQTLDLSGGELEALDPSVFANVDLENMDFLEFDPGWMFNGAENNGSLFTPLSVTGKSKSLSTNATYLLDNTSTLNLICTGSLTTNDLKNNDGIIIIEGDTVTDDNGGNFNDNDGTDSDTDTVTDNPPEPAHETPNIGVGDYSGGGGGGSAGGGGGGGNTTTTITNSDGTKTHTITNKTGTTTITISTTGVTTIKVEKKRLEGSRIKPSSVSLQNDTMTGALIKKVKLEAEFANGQTVDVSKADFGVQFTAANTRNIPNNATVMAVTVNDGQAEVYPFNDDPGMNTLSLMCEGNYLDDIEMGADAKRTIDNDSGATTVNAGEIENTAPQDIQPDDLKGNEHFGQNETKDTTTEDNGTTTNNATTPNTGNGGGGSTSSRSSSSSSGNVTESYASTARNSGTEMKTLHFINADGDIEDVTVANDTPVRITTNKFSSFYLIWYLDETSDEPTSDTESDTETDTTSDTESDTASDVTPDTDSESDIDTDNTNTPDKPDKPEPIGNLGDVDGDGNITANDALTILRASVGIEELPPDKEKLADVDGDGQITANDALAVLRFSVGFEEPDSKINTPITA